MMLYYLNNSERGADVLNNSLSINNQIQQRNDTCSFTIFQNSRPTENQDLKIYDGALVASHTTTTIVLKDTYQTNVAAFRAGQRIWLKIGDATMERATIASYTESTRTIVLTATPSISLSADDKIGELIFGGIIGRVADENVEILQNIQYRVTGISYAKIFDKKLVSDTWQDRDSRFIINDFVNTTVNYNSTVDDLGYSNNTDIQAEWIESADGGNPTVDTTDFMESASCGVFPWAYATGTARWSATPVSRDLSQFFGVTSGLPTRGNVMSWFKVASFTGVTAVKVRIGSSASDFLELTFTLDTTKTDWQYAAVAASKGVVTGTPDWTAADYAQLVVTMTSGSGSIRWNGLRVNAEGSFTLYNVKSTPEFADFRAPQMKPTALMNQLAKTWEYTWYVDYERDIHFVNMEAETAPYDITDTSNNFTDLGVEVDVSNLGNRVIVRGGEKTSSSVYAQVIEGTGEKREWLMKNKLHRRTLLIDNNTSTDTMEATKTTTTVKATAHGLASGDHIVNRTRGNAVREVTVVDANTFTVQAVTSQASGDTFSKFSVSKSVGVEGITDESTVDYVANSNEKSVRATESEPTYTTGTFLRFSYYERIPIQIQYGDSASADALKALGLGDGIFDLDPITDRNIKDTTTAISFAQARVREFSNSVINGKFKTDQKGIRAGQLLTVSLTQNGRNYTDNYVVQQCTKKQRDGRAKDYLEIEVTFGTTLFGWEEFMQKLLQNQDSVEYNVDDIVETFVNADETVETDDTNTTAKGGFKKATIAEDVTTDDTNQATKQTVPWHWEPSVGQAVATRWNLAEWS